MDDRLKQIIDTIERTPAFKTGGIGHYIYSGAVIVTSEVSQDFDAVYAILPLLQFKVKIRAYNSKVYLEIK